MAAATVLEARAAVDQILAELDAALHALGAAGAGTGRNRPIARLLTSRIARLRAAAGNLSRALDSGATPVDRRALREQLTHFHALTSALWTIQQSLDPRTTRHRRRADRTRPVW